MVGSNLRFSAETKGMLPVPTTLLEPPVKEETEVATDSMRLNNAVDRAAESLIAKQAPGGWWVGELQGDSIL
jgi:hypothetical protein